MGQLVMLYLGTVFLMYLSQSYYPVSQLREHDGRSFLWKQSDIFMIVTILWLTLFSALRTSYNDTINYITAFQYAQSIREWITSGMFLDLTGNPLSMLYRNFIRGLTDNYHIYFLFPAFFSSFSVIKLFKRYSVDPALSLIVFISIGTYVMYIAALKQCLAMFFLLAALPYAIEKKYVRFYVFVFIAVLFHTHAFMFAIIPFLMGRPWSKLTWMMLAAVLFAMATYNYTLGAFMNFAQSIGALVAENEVFDGHQINILRVLVYWVPTFTALAFRHRLFSNSTKTENLFVNMSIISSFILSIGLVEGANLYARMAGYFEIATAISLPWMIKKVFTKQSAQLVAVIAGVLYFGYFYYEFAVSKNFSSDYSAISLGEFMWDLFR